MFSIYQLMHSSTEHKLKKLGIKAIVEFQFTIKIKPLSQAFYQLKHFQVQILQIQELLENFAKHKLLLLEFLYMSIQKHLLVKCLVTFSMAMLTWLLSVRTLKSQQMMQIPSLRRSEAEQIKISSHSPMQYQELQLQSLQLNRF